MRGTVVAESEPLGSQWMPLPHLICILNTVWDTGKQSCPTLTPTTRIHCVLSNKSRTHPPQHPPSPAPCPPNQVCCSLRVGSSRTKLVLIEAHPEPSCCHHRTSSPLPSLASIFLHLSLPRPFATEVLREVGSEGRSDPWKRSSPDLAPSYFHKSQTWALPSYSLRL